MTSDTLASATKTFGIGRFLIDLPDHFQMLPNGNVEWTVGRSPDFYRIQIRTIRPAGTTPTFDSLVASRISEQKASHHFQAASQSRFILSRKVVDAPGSPVIVRSYASPNSTASFICEVFVERGPAVAVLSRRIFETNPPLMPEAVESQLGELALRIRAMEPATESAPGLGLGQLLVDASFDGETVTGAFRSSRWPEVLVSVSTRSLLDELDGGLLKRVDENSALLSQMGFRSGVLRRGSTTLAGAPAEELLETGKDRNKTVRSFMAEVLLRQPATKAKPLLTLGIKMGGQVGDEYVEPQLSDADSVALWDRVRASLRARPGAI